MSRVSALKSKGFEAFAPLANGIKRLFHRYVEVRESSIPNAGEGLFARTDIEAGRVVAYFFGVKRDIQVSIVKNFFPLSLTKRPNKLEHSSLACLSSLV
jgi:hypothetical protein